MRAEDDAVRFWLSAGGRKRRGFRIARERETLRLFPQEIGCVSRSRGGEGRRGAENGEEGPEFHVANRCGERALSGSRGEAARVLTWRAILDFERFDFGNDEEVRDGAEDCETSRHNERNHEAAGFP